MRRAAISAREISRAFGRALPRISGIAIANPRAWLRFGVSREYNDGISGRWFSVARSERNFFAVLILVRKQILVTLDRLLAIVALKTSIFMESRDVMLPRDQVLNLDAATL